MGSSTGSSDESTSGEPTPPGATTTGEVADDSTSTDGMPDMGTPPVPPPPPPPRASCEGAGDLSLLWSETEPAVERAEAVAVGWGMVAWTLGGFDGFELRVLDHEGSPLWSIDMPDIEPGWAEAAHQGMVIGESGEVVLAATIQGGSGPDNVLRWYEYGGALLDEDVYASPSFDGWEGLAWLPGGDVVAAGFTAEDMLVRRYAPGAVEVWTQTYNGPGSIWSSDVAVSPNGRIVVSGHSNEIPGPVLHALDDDGSNAWTHLAPSTGTLTIARNIAIDQDDRTWMAVQGGERLGGGDPVLSTVRRFDPDGFLEEVMPLDFRPNAIDIDPEGNLLIGGDLVQSDLVVVERRSPDWTLLARYERSAQWLVELTTDESCRVYVTIEEEGGGATLEKLD